jgi:CRISPR/Cas system Type II protein with McrA/HNH and RuvC-like nuclease domain
MEFEADHIIPISRNSTDELDNLALSCRICNLRKSDHTEGFDPGTLQNVRLFNPRENRWSEHFEQQIQLPYQILGKTEIGRATITRLDMNSSLQLRARRLWVDLGVFRLN